MRTPARAVRNGMRDVVPILVSVPPYGLVMGGTAAAAGFSVGQAGALSFLVNAGASQLAAVRLLEAGAPLVIIVLTGLVINARMVVYSASLAPYFQGESPWWRALIAFLIIDPVFALTVIQFRGEDTVHRRWYYLGAALPVLPAWVGSTMLGAAAGVVIPQWLPLQFAVPMVFLALVAGAIDDWPTGVAAGIGGTVAGIGVGLPVGAGILAGAVAGVAAGLLAEWGVPT